MPRSGRGWRAPGKSAAAAGALLALTLAACAANPARGLEQPASPSTVYHAYIANESSDLVSHVRFVPGEGVHPIGEISVGLMRADLDAPHGIVVSPDGEFWYVSLAHGTPYGSVWKFDTAADTLVARVQLGRFPASMGLSPDGQYLLVANFNLHGDLVPSGISIVYTPTMIEIARPTTCVMPHGGRFNASGTRHYSTCMHSEQLVELDPATFEVTRRVSVVPGAEGALDLADTGEAPGHAHGDADVARCSPTWATPARGERADRYVYVACNGSDVVLEVDVETQQVTRRFSTGQAPYNLETSPDGRVLLMTLRGEQAVALLDLDSGREISRIDTTRPVTHGVVVTADGRFAFVTNEAVGSTRGTVDVIDLARRERVASAELHHQPGGVDVLRDRR